MREIWSGVRNVGLDRHRAAVLAQDQVDRILRGAGINIGARHGGAFAGEQD
ncbi:hypothetical protein ACU4GD_37090 [Cupriavidus basilensis]